MKGWKQSLKRWRKHAAFMVAAPICCPIECGTHGQLMRIYGYTELKPPSVLLAPGAMVAVISRRPFEARIVCGPRASLGAHWVPQRSGTASAALNKMNGRHMEMDVSLMQDIRTDARFRSIASISMTLNNARLVEVNDTDVREGMRYRSQECSDAIEARIKAGFQVTMVSSALAGDMVYQVKWESTSDISARARLETMSQLAVELGGGTVRVTETEIRAEGLMWGIRDDAYLASLSIPNVVSEAIEPGQRHIGPEHVATIVNSPDAPVIPPPNSATHEEAEDVVRERRFTRPLAPLPEGTRIFKSHARGRLGRNAQGSIVRLPQDAPQGNSLSRAELAEIEAAFFSNAFDEPGRRSRRFPDDPDRTRGFLKPSLSQRKGAVAPQGQPQPQVGASQQPPDSRAPNSSAPPTTASLPPIQEHVDGGSQPSPQTAAPEPTASSSGVPSVPAPAVQTPPVPPDQTTQAVLSGQAPVAGGEMKTGSIVANAQAELAALAKVEAPKADKMPEPENDPVLEAYRWDRAGEPPSAQVCRPTDEPDWLQPRPRTRPSRRTQGKNSRPLPSSLMRSGSF